jgi:hypothetical protein
MTVYAKYCHGFPQSGQASDKLGEVLLHPPYFAINPNHKTDRERVCFYLTTLLTIKITYCI